MNAADRYRWDSQWAKAAEEYQRALAEFPDDAAARGGLGFCYMQTKQWQQALEEYEHILGRDPSNVIALSKTAELYAILNRRGDAYKAYLHLAELYSQAGQGARAEAAWQKAAQLSPDSPEPHERLATYYAGKKDIGLMIQERLAAAQGFLQRNEIAAARAQCEEVLRADTTNAQAQLLLSQIVQSSVALSQGANAAFSPVAGTITGATAMAGVPSGPLDFIGSPETEMVQPDSTSGGNTGIMGNTGSAGNFGGAANYSRPNPAASGINSDGARQTPHKRITASQVTGVLRQAQTFQTQGRFDDAIGLCEQILENGFDRPDARYFLGWLYQEQQRWNDAIRQFQLLLNDPDYALSCYYALGQCYRACGDLKTASMHFDEAVDRVNLDALTMEESDQLVQLCQEAAEAHRLLGELDQALTVYNALLGFLHSRGWNDKIAQVEFMLQQMQHAPAPPQTPQPAAPFSAPQQGNATRILPPEQMATMNQPPMMPAPGVPDAATIGFGRGGTPIPPSSAPVRPQAPAPSNTFDELPEWLTGILSDEDKTVIPNKQSSPQPDQKPGITNQPTIEQQILPSSGAAMGEVTMRRSMPTAQPDPVDMMQSAYMTKEAKPGAEELLNQMAGQAKEELLNHATDAIAASTKSLPENIRLQVVQAMRDIKQYISHGLLARATEECLRVIDMAPQYLDVHQVLCEIYVRQGKTEQAITKYGILVETYLANDRIDDAIATYRRILQLEPNNLTYRVRLINLLTSQGNKEELLRERSLAAETYLRLGYMERAVTELEQALQESPTSVPTRLNYALALQKLGRSQQAMAEYQRVLQVDPHNIAALVRWHISMITDNGYGRAKALEVLTRIRWQLRGTGQRNYDTVAGEYNHAAENYPHNADVHFALGQVHQQAGNFEKAIDSYTQAMRDSSLEAMARVSAAHCLLAQGKPEAAIQQLEQALQSARRPSGAPIDPSIWAARPREEGEEHQAPEVEISMLLAKAYGRTGRQDQMEATMRKVKRATTYQDEVYSTLAEISARQSSVDSALQEYADLVRHYRSSRQVDNAITVLNEMVRLEPQDARAHLELGDIYVGRGLLDEGIAELRVLADVYLRRNQKEEASAILRRIGNIYDETGNTEEALMNLRRAAELDPSDMDLLREVVGFCWRTGHTREAAQYQTIIARHYFDTHQVKESVAALQQLITLDRNNYEAYDMLGQTYQSVGEYEQASRVYKNLAKLNPGSTIARDRLSTLQGLRAMHQ